MAPEINTHERLGKILFALALFAAEITLLVQWGLTAQGG